MAPFVRALASPLGWLALFARDDGALVHIDLLGDAAPPTAPDAGRLDAAARQLAQYFAGERRRFDLVLAPTGTPFQLAAWEALRAIPFGETRSYREQARNIGRPTATRAIGAANARNPLPIVVPCHRVIGANGRLVGFAGGLDRKQWLLDHEARVRGGLRQMVVV